LEDELSASSLFSRDAATWVYFMKAFSFSVRMCVSKREEETVREHNNVLCQDIRGATVRSLQVPEVGTNQ
jgi:hypothetical protein